VTSTHFGSQELTDLEFVPKAQESSKEMDSSISSMRMESAQGLHDLATQSLSPYHFNVAGLMRQIYGDPLDQLLFSNGIRKSQRVRENPYS
jgi:hypothetical protein